MRGQLHGRAVTIMGIHAAHEAPKRRTLKVKGSTRCTKKRTPEGVSPQMSTATSAAVTALRGPASGSRNARHIADRGGRDLDDQFAHGGSLLIVTTIVVNLLCSVNSSTRRRNDGDARGGRMDKPSRWIN